MSTLPSPSNSIASATTTLLPEAPSYSQALAFARQQVDNGIATNYSCDGHSWLYLYVWGGTVQKLYDGPSTIGLPSLNCHNETGQARL